MQNCEVPLQKYANRELIILAHVLFRSGDLGGPYTHNADYLRNATVCERTRTRVRFYFLKIKKISFEFEISNVTVIAACWHSHENNIIIVTKKVGQSNE